MADKENKDITKGNIHYGVYDEVVLSEHKSYWPFPIVDDPYLEQVFTFMVEVTIKQKGLFKKKKKLNIDDFTQNKFSYGSQDEHFVLGEYNELEDSFLTLYNPNAIAQGITVYYPSWEKKHIDLTLDLFTTEDEIEDFFNLVIELCQKFDTNVFLYNNSIECTLDDVPKLIADVKGISNKAIENFLNDSETEGLVVFGAFNPIYFDKNALKEIAGDNYSDRLKKYLHDLQSQDLYYVRPTILYDEDNYYGIYIVTEECDSILPLDFRTSLDMMNLFIDEPIILDKWIVGLYSTTNDKITGYVDFDSFKDFLEFENLPKYDAAHIILSGLSNKQIEQIIEACINVDKGGIENGSRSNNKTNWFI